MPDLTLAGCTPVPLATYLKGLGILRVVSEQVDPSARGWWEADVFRLRSRLDERELVDFFAHRYVPTPIVSPWNGGSGFYAKDNQSAIRAIEGSTDPRLAPYREVIAVARRLVERLGLREQPKDEDKTATLALCRAEFPEAALHWLDAAFVLTAGETRYPPLLGTGGNDGRLEFSNNYMQHLLACLAGNEAAMANLEHALFGAARIPPALRPAAAGQFNPGQAGGPNATQGFEGDSLVNPWDFVLLFEGALLFAGAAARRLAADSYDKAAFPFTVSGTAAGYGTAADADQQAFRAETWLPLWGRPASLPELKHLLGEGRAQWGGRQARSAVDFARAAVSLGVDRGIDSFQRIGFLKRFGKNYLAVPLGRVRVTPRPEANVLRDIDPWLDALRRACGNENAPASWRQALRQVDAAVLEYCNHGGARRLQDVLITLGAAEAALARSVVQADSRRVPPLQGLSAAWVSLADDRSDEYRLAVALASLGGEGPVGPLRENLEPVRWERGYWQWNRDSLDAVWKPGTAPVYGMATALKRRLQKAEAVAVSRLPLFGRIPAPFDGLERFLSAQTDDSRLAALVRGLVAVRWEQVPHDVLPSEPSAIPPAFPRTYALFKLLYLPVPLAIDGGDPIHLRPEPGVLPRLLSGQVRAAAELAVRRLIASGLNPFLHFPGDLHLAPAASARLAAALLFPVANPAALARLVLRHEAPEPVVPDG